MTDGITIRPMQRWFIKGVNIGFLGLVFIGLPAATRAQWGGLQISPAALPQQLILWSLALATAGNAVAAAILVKNRKDRRLCWEWAALFGGLAFGEYAFQRGWIHFMWLKQTLRWVQSRF